MPIAKTSPHLSDADREKLEACGLSKTTIRQNGFRTVSDRETLSNILKKKQNLPLSGMVIPYRNISGVTNGFARVRPHAPRKTKNGGVIKYEQPVKTPNRCYFPKASIKQLKSDAPLYITEGEFKAAALAQIGYCAIGISGVDSWGKNGEFIDDLKAIPLGGRTVYIVFDFDTKPETRRNVAAAKKRFAKALSEVGADVLDIQLPATESGEKQGADDFLVAQGVKAFDELVEQAQPLHDLYEIAKTNIRQSFVVPPTLGDAAYYGLAGDFLRLIEPCTEATPPAMLAHFLSAVGMLAGNGIHLVSGGTKQPARINCVVVGKTNSGRKGTSFAPVNFVMEKVNEKFWAEQHINGLSSGEGLINFVMDQQGIDENGDPCTVTVEKRLMVVESEFSRVLANSKREGNILSQVLRDAYDNGNMATLTVNPRRVIGAHVVLCGHITPEELQDRLDSISTTNGFANRFCWFVSHSEKIDPFPEPFPEKKLQPIVNQLKRIKKLGDRKISSQVEIHKSARELWVEIYTSMRADTPGIVGCVTGRGTTNILRMALIYALLDAKITQLGVFDVAPTIREPHLRAAKCVWDYCEHSADLLFSSITGDKLCDKILMLLESGPMTRNDFNCHLSANQKLELKKKLERLESWKIIKKETVQTKGRPAELYRLLEG